MWLFQRLIKIYTAPSQEYIEQFAWPITHKFIYTSNRSSGGWYLRGSDRYYHLFPKSLRATNDLKQLTLLRTNFVHKSVRVRKIPPRGALSYRRSLREKNRRNENWLESNLKHWVISRKKRPVRLFPVKRGPCIWQWHSGLSAEPKRKIVVGRSWCGSNRRRS